VKQLASFPEEKADRHATSLLFDAPECRLVAFTLQPGQTVPMHRSSSTVVVIVVSGSGVFRGGESELQLDAGEAASYEPEELHGMTAGETGLRFIAAITPRPGAQSK
jgi:quercetin dioxygenase-like cupin family protein